jgi:MoaA/NifB/PqqE/SkfB family radical SAM enzyme
MIDITDIKLLDIEMTSHCNLHCPQCDRFDLNGFETKYMKLEHLDFSKIEKNLELAKLSSLEEVLLEGDHGDPLMHPFIMDIIGFFKNINRVHLVTNASLRNAKWWKDLAKFENLTVTFSIDGLQDTLNLYRINADFDKIMTNARVFIDAGGQAVWKYIVFQHNEHQVDEARILAHKLGFKTFKPHPSQRNFFDKKEFPIFVNGVNQNKKLTIASSIQPKANTRTIALQRPIDRFIPPVCSWLSNKKMYIDYTGNLIPCCMTSGLMWRKDISGKLWQKTVGDQDSINLYKHTLSEILSSDFYQNRLYDSLQSIKTAHHVCIGHCS